MTAEPSSEAPRVRAPLAGRARGPLGPWLYASHLWALWALAASNILLGVGLVTSPWTVRWRDLDWRSWRPLLVPTGLYAIFLVASTVLSRDPAGSVPGLGELFTLAGLLLALATVRGERDVRRVVHGVVLVSSLLALWGLAQLAWNGGVALDQRVRGPFSHYMTFAGCLLQADFLLLGQILYRRQGWRSPWRWVALAAINAALLATLTRGAWIAFLLVLVLLLLLRAPRYLAALVPAALLFLLLAPLPLVERTLSIGDVRDPSNYDRLCMAEAAVHMIRERPLFGIGPEMVRYWYPIYRHPTAPRQQVPHLHNTYLELAAGRGLLSLGAYLWLMAVALGHAVRAYRQEGGAGGRRADLYVGAFAALLAFNVAGLFEHNWGDTEVQRLALLAIAVPWCLRGAQSADES